MAEKADITLSHDRLLRSAIRRITAASEWATQAKLLNVAAELREAAKEISTAIYLPNPEDTP